MKTCVKCSKEKFLHCFYNNKQNKDGKTGMCIECIRAYQNQRYNNLPEAKKNAFIWKIEKNRRKSK